MPISSPRKQADIILSIQIGFADVSEPRTRFGAWHKLRLVLLIAGALLAFALPGYSYAKALSPTQARFLSVAEGGIDKIHRLWWNSSRQWFDAQLHGSARVATLWDVVPLFEALDGIALADPSARHKDNVVGFANFAESYLNRSLYPVAGYAPEPGQNRRNDTTWFDDNGWWGLAFLDAYQVTGRRRYLGDAETAFRFISTSGWDSAPGSQGGLWWNTQHTFFAGETLASGTELAARLYAITHRSQFLSEAQKFITWGNQWLWNSTDELYARLRTPQSAPGSGGVPAQTSSVDSPDRYPRTEAAKLTAEPTGRLRSETAITSASNIPPFDPTPLPYVQGPIIIAYQTLCGVTGVHEYCERAEALASDSAARFPELEMGPQYDAVYMRDMLVLHASDGNTAWYRIAKRNALRALSNANDGNGLFLKTWDGKPSTAVGSPPGSLQLEAATISVFAWLAAIP